MLMHVVGSEEYPFCDLPLGPDGGHLAARIIELVRIVRQQIEVQSVTRKLCGVESSLARSDGDIAGRQLVGRHGLGINVHGNAGEAGWESGLSRVRSVSRQSIQSIHQVTSQRVGAN